MSATARHLPELLLHQADRLGPRAALRYREHGLYRDLSWHDLAQVALDAAAALCEVGVRPGDRVGLLSENRPEWIFADLAILCASAVSVPLHAPLSAKQIEYQLADSGTVCLFVSTPEQAAKLAEVRSRLPALETVVQMEGPRAAGALSWQGFVQRGRLARGRQAAELERRRRELAPDSLATLMYTSGTTGNPKGVMLTHDNFLSNVRAVYEVFKPLDADEIFLNWLPLSHVYARTVDYYLALLAGVPLALARNADTVLADVAQVRPTAMSSVPRLYEKVVGAVAALPADERQRRLRGCFGGRTRWLGSGGAPLPPSVGEALREAGLEVLQGYGLTETSPVITLNRLGANRLGTVGPALPGVEIRIAPDGEILTRGPHVMKGYWKQPEATAAALDGGWFHTGDLGQLDEAGYLKITGRKKEMLVLSNGKKVAPSFVEGLLAAEPCIEQAVIYGEGKPFVSALVVPRWPAVQAAAGTAKANDAVYDFLMERVTAALSAAATWEKVRKIVVVPEPFCVGREELTVSLKLRREVIFDHHRAELEALYDEPPGGCSNPR